MVYSRNPESADVKSYQFLFPPSLFGVGSASAKQTNQRDKYAAHMAQQLDPMGVGVGVGIGPSGSNVIGEFLSDHFLDLSHALLRVDERSSESYIGRDAFLCFFRSHKICLGLNLFSRFDF